MTVDAVEGEGRLTAWKRTVEAAGRSILSAEKEERLRALGYIQ